MTSDFAITSPPYIPVMLNQYLWTAGYALTSGGFLAYWASQLGAEGFEISVILALPDLLGAFGLLTPLLLMMGVGVKRLWWTTLIASRLLLLAAFLLVAYASDRSPLVLSSAAGLFGLSQVTQSISFVSLLSWLPQLEIRSTWGRLFASTQMAKAICLLVMPPLVIVLKLWVLKQETETALEWFYLAGGLTGIGLQLCSVLPLVWVRSSDTLRRESEISSVASLIRTLKLVWSNRQSRLLLTGFAWLSAFQGLTQAPFYLYQIRHLKVGLIEYFLLAGLMYALQALLSPTFGVLCDLKQSHRVLVTGLIIATTGVTGFVVATPGFHLPLWFTYACWGGFAAVNIAGQVLIWQSLPPQSHPMAVAWFRMLSSTIAGITGLLGGLWLDALILDYGVTSVKPYMLLIALSLAGRYLSLVFFARLECRIPRP